MTSSKQVIASAATTISGDDLTNVVLNTCPAALLLLSNDKPASHDEDPMLEVFVFLRPGLYIRPSVSPQSLKGTRREGQGTWNRGAAATLPNSVGPGAADPSSTDRMWGVSVMMPVYMNVIAFFPPPVITTRPYLSVYVPHTTHH